MLTITFTCRGLKARTCPCKEGSEVGVALGIPKAIQVCCCKGIVDSLPRPKGVAKKHTCIRELPGLGRVFSTQEEKDILHIEVRLSEAITGDTFYAAIAYLEGRHERVTQSVHEDTPGEARDLFRMESMRPPTVDAPPENEEELTPHTAAEPRPRNIPPEEIPGRGYRGPIAEPPKEA